MPARIGLVLGAGGTTGHGFHCGVLAALHDVLGYDARTAAVLVGTSAGSVVASLLRAGLSGRDLAARACGEPPSPQVAALIARIGPPAIGFDLPPPARRSGPASLTALRSAAFRPWNARLGTLASAALPEGTLPTSMISEPFTRLFGSRWPPDLRICAVRLDDGQRVVFPTDQAGISPGEAVAASCAIPGWFAPVTVGGHRYVDGGAWSPTNADVLTADDLDAVIISSPMSGPPRVAASAGDGPLRLLHRAYLSAEAARLRRRGMTVIVVEPTGADLSAMGPNAMDAGRRAEVTRTVRASVSARLQHGELAHAFDRIDLGHG